MASVKRKNQRTTQTSEQIVRGAEAYEAYLRAKKHEWAKPTYGVYESLRRRAILPWLGTVNIFDITSDIIRDIINDFAQTHNPGGTHHLYRHLKAFINWTWIEYDCPKRNPMTNVRVKNPSTPPKQGITQEEVDKLFRVVKNTKFPERDTVFLMLLCDTGLRRSSIVNLKMADVDANHCELVVHEKDQLYHIKTFGQTTAKAIKKYLACLEDVHPDDPFWLSLDGSHLMEPGLREVLRRLCKEADIPEHQYHDFRRYYALQLYNATHDIYTVSRALDHKSVEVTKRYLAIDDRENAEVARIHSPMDRKFGQTGVRVNRA